MASNLAALLNLRRSAEEEAQKVLGEAAAARLNAEREQQRLDSAAEQARHALEQETRRCVAAPAPTGVADGLRRESFRQRLAATVAQTASKAAHHRQGPLDQAQAAENAAAARFCQAREERLALEKVKARQEAEQHKQTERRAENAVGDWIHASPARRKPRG